MKTVYFDDLSFTDDFAFCKIMTEDEELCKDITQLITGRRVKEIVKKEGQKTIKESPDGKGVRFDVYFEDEDAVYDIEMQTTNRGDLPRRTRYYHSLSDLAALGAGAPYSKLKDNYVIFICTFDPFGEGEYRYVVKRSILGYPEKPFDDGMQTIFVSSESIRNDIPDDMRAFLTYLKVKTPNSELTERIDYSLRRLLNNEERRQEFMFLLERDEIIRDEARTEGRAEGRAAERIETIRRLSARLSEEELIELGYSEEEIRASRES